ncbi:DNA adenine methylase [Rouxiella silvae]|uniref:Site-specific DNA-methyltransferase (adenine-specific) n=1 Tax=Rouxiella silvae TaxID=1646373 RepID=A0AA40X158_9GAMM|nr:DNA adenine methylase [Rouxiella silvae]MBF6636212.1 DNA adenine methylase [Rouxiella silvae]
MNKTILKWAGSKARAMDTLKMHLPTGHRLVEPFAGSCAVMMNTDYEQYLIADVNPDLINMYQQIKNDCEFFMLIASGLFNASNNNEDTFRRHRFAFNKSKCIGDVYKAAIFLYLNRHCFNGLCRYNKSGGFNVPFGKYKAPYFPKAEILAFAEKAQRCTFICCSFEETLRMAMPGDVVYCDPPYLGNSKTEGFVSYHTAGFGYVDHEFLALALRNLSSKGYPVVVSNNHSDRVLALYTGFEIASFDVRRSVGASADSIKTAREVIASLPAVRDMCSPCNERYCGNCMHSAGAVVQ